MRLLTYIVLLVLTVALFSCMPPQTQEMDVAQVRMTVEDITAKWEAAFNQGDAAGVAAFYTDDAIVMPPNHEMVRGNEAIQQFFDEGFQMGVKDLDLTTVEVSGSGSMAYEVGNYTITLPMPDEGTMTDSGKYVVVWKKQSDGSWKMYRDIWNSSVPLPEM